MKTGPVVWITDSTAEAPRSGKHMVTYEWLHAIEGIVGAPIVVRVDWKPRVLRRIALLLAGMPGLWHATIGGWRRIGRELASVPNTVSPALVVVDHFRLAWTLPQVRRRFTCPVVLLAHNVESSARRSYLGRAPRAEQAAAALELPGLLLWERFLARAFDIVVTLSEADTAHFAKVFGCRDVRTISPSLQSAARSPTDRARSEKPQRGVLLYVGSFDYHAKRANARWFLTKVAPLLVARHPDCQVVIVGRGSERLRDHSWARVPWLRIEGEVADVGPYYDSALAAIVPERIGGGFKTKVLEAVWNRVPVIGPTRCLAPLCLTPGRDYLRADTPQEWVAATAALIDDEDRARRIADSAARVATGSYAHSAFEVRVRDLFASVAVEA